MGSDKIKKIFHAGSENCFKKAFYDAQSKKSERSQDTACKLFGNAQGR